MKKNYLVAAAFGLIVLAAACKKENTSYSNVPAPAVLPTSQIIINGVSELTLQRGDTGSLALVVALDSGKQEQIDLSLSGLPADSSVTAMLSASSGVPKFTTHVMFNVSKYAPTGSHTITLTAKSASGFSKTYTFKLNIVHPSECAMGLTGSYLGAQICDTDTFAANINMFPSSSVKNRVQIMNFANRSLTVTANLNCATNTIDVPKQTVTSGFISYTVWGSGSFTDTSLMIKYYGESMFDTLDCTDTYMKQ